MKVLMKRITISMLLTLVSLILMGCTQESTKIKNSVSTDPLCIGSDYFNKPGCPGYGSGNGTTTPVSCTNPTINDKTCANYCTVHPTGTGCVNGVNCNIYPYAAGCPNSGNGSNPYPNYRSVYHPKNWMSQYPYYPSLNCPAATTPTNISYTPYETRKGTVTLKGQENYDPSSGQPYFDTTSELLQSVNGSRSFFWGDSTLKVRFKANFQPDYRNTNNICPGRVSGMSTMKGYGRIKFDVTLVGTRGNGTTSTVILPQQTVDVNKCTPAIDLRQYADEFPNGIYLKVSNVQSNQNVWADEQIYDTYGFIYPQNPHVQNTWGPIRNAECWSLDIEVAADGTKTFN